MLVYNAGSSSLKFSLFEAERESLLAEGSIDWSTTPSRLVVRRAGEAEIAEAMHVRTHAEGTARILGDLRAGPAAPLRDLGDLAAVGHRVVHGGDRHTAAVITPAVKEAIAEFAELAPLHNPAALEGIAALETILPSVPQVAAFDTAFHATLSEAARTYPVPRAWTRKWRLRRYGFHGLSHSYCAARAAEMLHRNDARLVIAHLGNGASVSAVRDGACVDTSMGFTPLEGLMMGTRSGTVDPGMLIHLMRRRGVSAADLDRALNDESGLLGVSGISSDMRQVLAAAPHDANARLAVEVYVHRVRQSIGAMAATLGGVDALVFTAGVGEHSAEIRERVCGNLGHLGLTLDRTANQRRAPDADIASATSPARILAIATREDLSVLRETWRLVGPTVAAGRPGPESE